MVTFLTILAFCSNKYQFLYQARLDQHGCEVIEHLQKLIRTPGLSLASLTFQKLLIKIKQITLIGANIPKCITMFDDELHRKIYEEHGESFNTHR